MNSSPPPTRDQLNKLAKDIAATCKWDDKVITNVFYIALTDANCHTNRTKIEKLFQQLRHNKMKS